MMGDYECPWCEAPLPLELLEAQAATCPECHTTWSYEEESRVELPLAA